MRVRIGSLSRRRFLATTAAASAAAGLPRRVDGQASDTLRVRSYGDLQVLDPAFLVSAPETDIMECLYHKLIAYKPGETWEWENQAAATIEAKDPTHIAFTLRNDLGWNNGFGELTAEDVKFSFERIADPALASPYAGDWATLDHVEVTDARSGTIVLKEPFAPLWSTTLPATSGMILCKKAVEALPEKKFTTEAPAASGPYEVTSWVPRQRTVLGLNLAWQGPKPAFAKIEVVPIEDELTAENGFMAGDLDCTAVALSALPNLRAAPPTGARLVERPSLKYVWVGINQDNPQFADARVRRAVQLVIDVGAILEAAYFGVAQPATGIVPPGLIGHRDANKYGGTRDVAQAKALLAEAGFPEGFSCRIDLQNKQTYQSIAQVVQANLAEVGIVAEINVHDSGVWWSMGDESKGEQWKDLQIMVNRFSSNPDPGWYTMWFTTDQVGVWNWERFSNKEFDDLHARALVEPDPAKRDAMYRTMQDLMEESGDYTFITHELSAAIHRDWVVPALLPDGSMLWRAFGRA